MTTSLLLSRKRRRFVINDVKAQIHETKDNIDHLLVSTQHLVDETKTHVKVLSIAAGVIVFEILVIIILLL